MKKVKFAVLAALVVMGFSSCDKNNDIEEPPVNPIGVYVLNSGTWGGNNSTLSLLDENLNVYQDVFKQKNGIGLGDSGQDIIVYGHKMYISVYNSDVIFVTDLNANKIAEIKLTDYKQPRYLTSYKGNVYATYFDGGVARIDTTNFATKTIKVGDNPEQLKVANGKLFVANSGGMSYPSYGNTVSVVDLNSFSIVKEIEVVINPCLLEVDKNDNVYLLSMGNYLTGEAGYIAPSFQIINSSSYSVEHINLTYNDKEVFPAKMVYGNGSLYFMELGYDANWKAEGSFYVFNTSSKKIESNFFTDGTKSIPSAYSLGFSANSLFIGSSDYTNTGDMYVFSKEGVLLKKFDTGINPIAVTPMVFTWN